MQFYGRLGIRIIFYLDDTFIMARSRETVLHQRDFVMSLLSHLEFIISVNKSYLSPAQCFTFLAVKWDTLALSIALPDDKIDKLQSSTLALITSGNTYCCEIQCFLGHTNFSLPLQSPEPG